MREILFRGKRVDNGEWVEGYYYTLHLSYEISLIRGPCDNGYQVDPSTVGQFTGLTDRCGVRIFERDIIKQLSGEIVKVVFAQGEFYGLDKYFHSYPINAPELFEIIGNIHDNPELLEGEA